jgi:hypothetical protein
VGRQPDLTQEITDENLTALLHAAWAGNPIT